MAGKIHLNPKLLVARLQKAMNDHDVDAFVDCCDPLYYGEEPAHPDRASRGREKVRAQWSTIFNNIPDFSWEVARHISADDVTWIEWHWSGTLKDKTKLDMRGVSIFGVREDHVTWSRIYMEPVEEGGAGMAAAVDKLYIPPKKKPQAG